MKKIIILLCRSKIRKKALNNFCQSRSYGNIFIITFCGPFFFYLGVLINSLNIFKCISLEGNPNIKNKNKGYNFWLGGTYLKIPDKNKLKKNNLINMITSFKIKNNNAKLLQLYPITNNNIILKKNVKIIYASSLRNKVSNNTYDFWRKYNKKFLENLSFFSTTNIIQNQKNLSDIEKFQLYRETQSLIRVEIIKRVYKKFQSKMFIMGNDWKKKIKIKKSNDYSLKYLSNLYQGNVCLDLGSNAGPLTLYPRSIEIIENNGALLQLKQNDALKIFRKKNINKFTFSTFDDLYHKIECLLINPSTIENQIKLQQSLFTKSKEKIYKQLKNLL